MIGRYRSVGQLCPALRYRTVRIDCKPDFYLLRSQNSKRRVTMGQTYSERLNDIAVALAFREARLDNAPSLDDIARALSEIANELEGFDLEPREGRFPTPRQALALGRFLDQVMRDEQRPNNACFARVSRGGAGLSDNYLYVRLGDGYEGGIDREGRVST